MTSLLPCRNAARFIFFAALGIFSTALISAQESAADAENTPPLDSSPLAPKHFEVRRIGSSKDMLMEGLQIAVFSAIDEGETIALRAGFLNTGTKPFNRPLRYDKADFYLDGGDVISREQPIELPPELATPVPRGESIAPRSSSVATLRFKKPKGGGPYAFQVTDFPDIKFRIDRGNTFTPPDPENSPIESAIDLKVYSKHPTMAVLPWKISRTAVDSEGIHIDISFANETRHALEWKGSLTGFNARLVDIEGTLTPPTRTSGRMDTEIGPMEGAWPAGFESKGTLTFPNRHPHAIREFQLLFPHYPPIQFRYEPASRTYTAAPRGGDAPADLSALPPPVAGERAYFSLNQFFSQLGGNLTMRDRSGFLDALDDRRGAKTRGRIFLSRLAKIPLKRAAFIFPPNQPIAVNSDGSIEGVKVVMRYLLHGTTDDNEFVSLMRCDLQATANGGWALTDFVFIRHPPFWTLGYTGLEATKHFLLFYNPALTTAEVVAHTAGQAERGYRTLSQKKFSLEDRYPAFFVSKREDFKALTTRDPGKYSGVASSFYEIRDGEFYPVNRAMYINDSRFMIKQTLTGMNDRQQTITHELAHLALARYTRPYTPAWLVEGTAVYHAGQLNPQKRRALIASGVLPQLNLHDISRSPILGSSGQAAQEISLNYIFAGETVAWLAKRFGEDKIAEFYQAFSDLSVQQLSGYNQYGAFVGSGGEEGRAEIVLQLTELLVPRFFGITLGEIDSEVHRSLFGG